MVLSTHPTYSVPEPKMHLQFPPGVPVADQVVITFCDCSAAGPRMLHALQASTSGSTVSRHAVNVSSAEGRRPTLQNPSEPATANPFLLINVTANQATQPQVSFICINTSIPDGPAAHLVAAVVAWMQGRWQASAAAASTPQPVVVAAAALLTGLKTKSAGAHVLPINGAAVPSALASAPLLPPSTKLKDSFLAMLTHCLYVAGLPALCLLVPGHKPSVIAGLSDSVDTVMALASALEQADLLPAGACAAPAVSGLELLHRWYADAEGGDDMMYT